MAIIARLATRFNTRYEERPVLTMMVTNAVLGGIADTVAQSITSIRTRQQSLGRDADAKDDTHNIEIWERNKQSVIIDRELIPTTKLLAPPFDFERLTRFMAYGFGMAPIQFKWFRFLENCFPVTSKSAMAPSLKRVILDQLIFAPVGT
ncbi:integral membrane protein mpv17 pmp22 family [Grosmannia clavigera kw1407]|uniref:Integral membrane protein mpv17 pmp22 family n=1 Tax=Grosmannia clavigera (strain kw1407 / UAMH 11150) TaxID=655863 RepID=F0XL45_GROCL|nr:integral membrane protein mpv17 pmp22 family [Grosmannia clavigera kw1407]EFX01729.1 integral membrane protein mpv17 pmp22 family [Grosmannia clavigera kw1407]